MLFIDSTPNADAFDALQQSINHFYNSSAANKYVFNAISASIRVLTFIHKVTTFNRHNRRR
jgi:hypothetical protein